MSQLKDFMDHGQPHSQRRETFCGQYVQTGGDGMRAYRLAFVVDPKRLASQVFDDVQRLLKDPGVAARIQEMRDAAAAACGASIEQLAQDWWDIANADFNEVCEYRRVCCRFCWGIDNRYQWTSEAEYADKLDEAIRLSRPAPDMAGGFGFNGTKDPSEHCPACFGQGIGTEHFHDTRKLSRRGKLIYRGVKRTKDGIQVMLADPDQARVNLARMLGAFKDTVTLPGQAQVVQVAPAPVPLDQAQQTYMRLVRGGK